MKKLFALALLASLATPGTTSAEDKGSVEFNPEVLNELQVFLKEREFPSEVSNGELFIQDREQQGQIFTLQLRSTNSSSLRCWDRYDPIYTFEQDWPPFTLVYCQKDGYIRNSTNNWKIRLDLYSTTGHVQLIDRNLRCQAMEYTRPDIFLALCGGAFPEIAN